MLDVDDRRGAMDHIVELTSRARTANDPTVEAQVVTDRYHLGRDWLDRRHPDQARAVPPTAWPVSDPFPRLSGAPPRVRLDELDVELLRGSLAHHGCLVVHGFFSETAMATLRDDIDQFATGFDRWIASGGTQTTPSFFEPFEEADAVLPISLRNMCGPLGTFYAADSPRAFIHMIDAFDEAGMPALLSEYLQEPVLLGLEKTSLRRVPPGVPTAWHQDGIKFGCDVGLLNIWVPLCPCGVDAPTLGILPKRVGEILPLDTDSAVPWEIRREAIDAIAEGVPLLELELEPGDAVLFDEMLVHSTVTHDGMHQLRYGADAWFFPVSQFPADLYKPLAYTVA